MQCAQTIGIDLPMKALVWKDVSGQVWLGYNDLTYLAKRHGAVECGVVDGMGKTLSTLVSDALGKGKGGAN